MSAPGGHGARGEARRFSPPAASGDRYTVHLRVDGEDVSLKAFLHDMVGGSVAGLVSGLRGVDDPDEVVIEVRKTR